MNINWGPVESDDGWSNDSCGELFIDRRGLGAPLMPASIVTEPADDSEVSTCKSLSSSCTETSVTISFNTFLTIISTSSLCSVESQACQKNGRVASQKGHYKKNYPLSFHPAKNYVQHLVKRCFRCRLID